MASINNPSITPPKLGDGNSSLHHTTKRLLTFRKTNFLNMEGFNNSVETALNDPTDKTYKNSITSAYNSLYAHHEKFTNEENLINRMERKSQIRNTLFRGITTLAIGFSIMFVYWVASELGISMPLLRVPV
ncbi:hypothetical protein AB4259_21750 [Vibrio amylolyticus]|uniref:hypothetical protein n=1 Tax=Vibrio amylolyticus TaxID=2847292 RepID=UPI00354F5558